LSFARRRGLDFFLAGTLRAARGVDVALAASGVAAAVGAVAFACFMLARSDHPPEVAGLEYLSIFAKPHGAVGRSHDVAPGRIARSAIDMAPVGAVSVVAATPPNGASIVAAQANIAWIRVGGRIFAVRPGDDAPGLGPVAAIVLKDGRWRVVDQTGATLLSSAAPEAEAEARAPRPFSRRMIFGAGD
jgi:hypothetical protein